MRTYSAIAEKVSPSQPLLAHLKLLPYLVANQANGVRWQFPRHTQQSWHDHYRKAGHSEVNLYIRQLKRRNEDRDGEKIQAVVEGDDDDDDSDDDSAIVAKVDKVEKDNKGKGKAKEVDQERAKASKSAKRDQLLSSKAGSPSSSLAKSEKKRKMDTQRARKSSSTPKKYASDTDSMQSDFDSSASSSEDSFTSAKKHKRSLFTVDDDRQLVEALVQKQDVPITMAKLYAKLGKSVSVSPLVPSSIALRV